MRYMLVGCDHEGERINFMNKAELKDYLSTVTEMFIAGEVESISAGGDTISIVFEDLSSAEVYKLARWSY